MFFDRHSTGPLKSRSQTPVKEKSTRSQAIRSASIAAVERLEQRALFSVGLGTPQAFGFGGTSLLRGVAFGDINGDGLTDAVIADAGNAGSPSDDILLGGSDGTLREGGFTNLPNTLLNTGVLQLVDVNNDGHLDIIQAMEPSDHSNAQLIVMVNNGDGTFFNKGFFPAIGSHPQSITFGDTNNDNHIDLLASSAGNGGSESPTTSQLQGNGDATFNGVPGFTNDHVFETIVASDYDGDQKLDIATPYGIQYGRADGTFNSVVAYPAGNGDDLVIAGDFNGDGFVDIALAPGADQAGQPGVITLLLNQHNTQVFAPSTISLGAGVNDIVSFTAGDLDGDGVFDLVASIGPDSTAHANTVAVLRGQGGGTYDAPLFFNVGGVAGQVIAARFTNQVRDDVLVIDPVSNQAILLPNSSSTASTTSITSSMTSSVQGQVVQLVATVSGQAGLTPAGTVTFFDGATPIGSGTLIGGLTTLAVNSLGVGDHSITAQFSGSSQYQVSNSQPITHTVIASAAANSPAIDVQITSLKVPAVAIPGDKVSTKLLITDHGNLAGAGQVAIKLYASQNGLIDGSAIQLPVPSLAGRSIKLTPGKSTSVSAKFAIPLTLPNGVYEILAQLVPISGLANSDVSAGFGPGPGTFQLVRQFGTVGARKNVKFQQTTSDGGVLTYSISGPGTGSVTGTAAIITANGTTTASKLNLTKKGGNGFAAPGQITVNGSLSSFGNSKVLLGVSLTVTGTIKTLTLGDLSNNHITISGSGVATKMNFSSVDTVTLITASPISSMKLKAWTGTHPGLISAPSVGTISCIGDFDPVMSLTAPGLDVKSVTAGGIDGGLWGTVGNVGKVVVKGNGWINGGILAGTGFGADHFKGGGDDTFGAAIISSVTIAGNVSTSLFAAGLNPENGNYLDGDDVLIAGSSIGKFFIGGTMESGSRILSANLPPVVQIQSTLVNTATDPRFKPI